MKAKITIIVEVEYELVPQDYPAGLTPEQMLAIDVASAESDAYMTLASDSAKWTVKGELLNGPNPTPDQQYSPPPA